MSAKCCVCTDEFSGIDDLEAHISADHYGCLPFECEKCKFSKFPTEFAIKRHYEEDHGLVEYYIRYRVSREIFEKKQKIRECLERCLRHSDVGSGQHHRNVSANDYVAAAAAAVVAAVPPPPQSAPHSHYQNRQLHESEFLVPPPKSRGGAATAAAAQNHSEMFQQQQHGGGGGPLLSSTGADLRHQQHQSDFGIGAAANEADAVTGYETIGGPTLIGNLLEHIKPDVDAGALTHFDQLYSSEVTTTVDGSRRMEKFVTTTQPGQEQLAFIAQKQALSGGGRLTPVSGTGKKLNGNPPNMITIQSVLAGGIKAPLLTTIPGGMPSTGAPSIRPAELQCLACQRMVVNRSTSLMYHVNVKHLKLALYKCRQCGEEFLWNKSAAIRHAQRHGGDESLIENNSERLFPTLNRHRREYFNLARRGIEDSPPPQHLDGGSGGGGGKEEQDDELLLAAASSGSSSSTIKRCKLESNTPPEMMTEVKGEPGRHRDEEEEEEEMEGGGGGTTANVGDDDGTSPNNNNSAVDDVGNEAEQQHQTGEARKEQTPSSILARLMDITRGGRGNSGGGGKCTATSESQQQQQPSSSSSSSQPVNNSGGYSAENLKVQKSVQCSGCGDMVVNQEWIMLNHVNTKHLHLPLYKCVSCDKPFENYLRSYAVRHAKFYHAGDETLLLDQRELYWDELRNTCTRLFKSGGGGGVDTSS